MSRTQKDINQEIKTLESQIDDIQNIRKHRPELVELEEKINKIKQNYREEIETQVSVWNSDIYALKNELKKKKIEGQIQLSERVEKWFRNYKSGIGWGYKEPKIVWISEDERYVIITNPGGTAGTGTAMGTGGYYYASSTHWLTETIEGYTYLGQSRGAAGTAPKWLEFDGRLTKEKKAEMIAFAEELRNKDN